nr:MAG TPA: hypothetical protein [Caudoviricetes sp.]
MYLRGAKILAINASTVKQHHLTGSHHQPIQIHQKMPRCLVSNCVSDTI